MLSLVPPFARQLLLVGQDLVSLGEAIRAADADRTVHLLRDPERVDTAPWPPGSLECVLYRDALAQTRAPVAVLRAARRLLSPNGVVLAWVLNAQHYTHLQALLTGDLPPDADRWAGRTCSGWLKVFLDAGLAPTVAATVSAPMPPSLREASRPLLETLGLHPARTERHLDASHYLIRATPLPDAEPPPDSSSDTGRAWPFSFVACVADEQVLQANLLRSPCLEPGTPHEVILLRGCPSAADGLNAGLARARHPLVVCLHQDVYLPDGWDRRFRLQYLLAERRFGPLGVAGVYGVTCEGERVGRAGHVVDRERLLREPPALPAAVDTLDELLLALPRDTPLRFDPQLGFHFYGADCCLEGARRGLPSVAVDALCLHNSRSAGLPSAFYPSAARFAVKWRHRLPVATSCVHIDAQGCMRLS
jgi:hypothetical protein